MATAGERIVRMLKKGRIGDHGQALRHRQAGALCDFPRAGRSGLFASTALVCAVNNVAVPSSPSQFAAEFSVAANEATDPLRFDYNPAPPVEFGAPGIDVQMPCLHGSIVTATGNSFAAPCLAGHVARILASTLG
jgi:hypothetical protein